VHNLPKRTVAFFSPQRRSNFFIPNKNFENLRKLFKKGTNPGQWNANGNPAWEICGNPFQWNANGNPDWESFGNPVQWNALHGKAALLRK
jgi:hypothetical protein